MKDGTTDRHKLPSLVSSRICHDLVNPLGAIGNGLELVLMTGQTASPEITLIRDSIESAAARLDFFRIAFGLSGPDQVLTAAEARRVLGGFFGTTRLKVTWAPDSPVPRAEARLALLLTLCAETALPMGGQVDLRHGELRWTLSATGPRLVFDPAFWNILAEADTTPDLSAGMVQFALAGEAAQALGRSIVVDAGEEDLEVSF